MSDPMDNKTRQRASRARRKADSDRRRASGQVKVEVWLDADAAKLLEEMVDKHWFKPLSAAKQDIINRAIGHYAKSLDYKV
jgi:hypothetical protein